MSANLGSKTRRWYLVYAKPQKEEDAKLHLDRQGYETFLPFIKRKKKVRGQLKDVIEALFPRYLFIRLDTSDDNWGPIRSTIGVSNLVRFGFMPAIVPDNFVAMLKEAGDEQNIHVLEDKELKKGDKIRLVDGAMEGYEGVFQAKSGKERVVVLLNIAGHCAEVQMPGYCIEPA